MSFTILLDASNPNDVAEGKELEIIVNGPGDTNRLLIFTGTAIVSLRGPDETEGLVKNRDVKITLLNSASSPKDFRGAATFVSLAAEASGQGDPNNANDEWSFDISGVSTAPDPDLSLVLRATLAVGIDSFLLRIAYQANVLARV